VLYHWERELRRYFPGISAYIYHGPGRRRDLLRSTRPIVFITTYATVANDVDAFTKTPLFYLVLDEATAIKNPTAARTHAVKALNAAHRLALSGTPVENRPAELWSLFDFLMRGHMGNQATFQRQFENPILSGDATAAERLGKRIRPFILRRTKSAVAKDLPEKIETQEWCELTEEQRQLYGEMQEQIRRLTALLKAGETVDYATSILPVLTYLLQICDHPAIINHRHDPIAGRSEKFDWVVEKIEEILAGDEQVVVFSRFLDMLSLLERAMQERAVRYVRIDGSTDNRQQLIDLFNERKAQVALCSLLGAGHGINLTAANHVIHADRWWNPAVEDQATDRVHRIGQNRTVYVHRIITGGTLEERLNTLLAKKRDMAGRIIDAAGGPMGGWTREELIDLLKPLG
jgi:SNF2 family DNA or RNA helicase